MCLNMDVIPFFCEEKKMELVAMVGHFGLV